MSLTDPVLNLEELLQPFAGDNPAGVALRYAPVYDEIDKARKEEPNFQQGEWARELKVADWRKVVDLSIKALRQESKDLQIAAWLLEGLLRRNHTNHFGGLRDGLKLISGLHEAFWENFYPAIDPEDDEPLSGRTYILEALDRVLPLAVRNIPITRSEITNLQYSWQQWQESKSFALPDDFENWDESDRKTKRAELENAARAANKITAEQWQRAQNGTPPAYYEELHACLTGCREELSRLHEVFTVRYENAAPRLQGVESALTEVAELAAKIYQARKPPESPDTNPGPETGGTAETEDPFLPQRPKKPETAVQNRQEAFRRLEEIAAFFQRSEPHNPVSYLVRRAIRYGQMPLEKWLEEVIKESPVLEQLRETLGIPAHNPDGEG